MKLKNIQVQRQRQTQKTKLIYAASAVLLLTLITVFTFVFNIGNVRKVFASPGTTYTASQSGNWSSASTWGGAGIPSSADNVKITNNCVVRVDITNAACTSVVIAENGIGADSGTLTFATTGSPALTVSGGITVGGNQPATVTMQNGATLSVGSFDATLTTNLNAGTVVYTASGNIVATTYNNLTINSGSNTETLTGTTTVNGTLTISSGTLALSSYTLDMKGNIVNNATFSPGTGTVTYDNTTAQTIGGASVTFYNLTINNAGGVTLAAPVTVTNTLTLTGGKLKLAANKLIVTGIISGGGSSSFIETNSTGVLEMVANHTTGTVFPIGGSYNPITIKPLTADATFDVSVANEVTDKLAAAIIKHAVNETWTVKLKTGSTQNVIVIPQWNQSDELTSFTRSTSYVSSRTSQVSGDPTAIWTPTSSAGATSGTNPYTRTSGNISMSTANTYYIGVGDNVSALPVTLIAFNANYGNNNVELTWTTASEINNNYFDIERSTNGETWQAINRVEGHGNSSYKLNYDATDDLAGIIPTGDVYYRLKQVDFNGKTTYSMVRSVSIANDLASTVIKVYPNPTMGELNVNWNGEDNEDAILRLVNINGATLYTENVTGTGAMHKQIDMSNYKPGTYIVQIVTDKNANSQTVIKK